MTPPISAIIAKQFVPRPATGNWRTALYVIAAAVALHSPSAAQPHNAVPHNDVPYNAVQIAATVTLMSADSSQSVVVEERIWDVPLGKRFSAFLANMSLELLPKDLDSQRLEITVFLTTIGSRPDSRNKRFTMELELPAFIGRIRGKNGATYRLRLVPQKFTSVDLSGCEYDHRDSGSFRIDPTANFDLYYARNTLGDYHWNKVKELLEQDYRSYRDAFDFNMTGKLHYYLYPCASPTLAWDPRFGYAIDPARSQAQVIYSHGYMGASPLVATLTQTLRISGYAPPFLAEGISSYFYFHDYEVLRALRNGKLLHLHDLLTTRQYYQADPLLATAQAGSFCRFLADTYGVSRFRKLYQASDDLTIAGNFPELYDGADIDALENQWIVYLKKMHPAKSRFSKRASLEGAANNLDVAISVLQEGLRWDTTFADTLSTLKLLAPLYTQTGKYDLALKTNQALFDKSRPTSGRKSFFLLRVAYLSALTGEFTRSREAYDSLERIDSLRLESVDYGRARLLAFESDTAGAIAAFDTFLNKNPGAVATVESALLQALLLGVPGTYQDTARSRRKYEQAYKSAVFLVNNAQTDPLNRFRQGMAEIGLGKYEEARQNLDIALFLEFRHRQLGRELVGLGNLADLLGNRQEALAFYHRADSLDQSVPGQRQIQRYINEPFTFGAR
ncbi:MAG: hypothetical protein IH914_07125 [candidate division Zixibacteria bacterium]|nr:hypothetical protein [candidate division Zixibacteria bacterium]